MLSYTTYRLIHLAGIGLFIVALAGVAFAAANGGSKDDTQRWKLAVILHGVGLVLALIGGFGMAGRAGMLANGLPGWIHAKITLWLVAGALVVIPKRLPKFALALWVSLPGVIVLGSWLAQTK
jgi:hypothetical protein